MNAITLKSGYKVQIVEDGSGFRAKLVSPGVGTIMEPHGSDRVVAVTNLIRDLKQGFSTGDVDMAEEIEDHVRDALDMQDDANVYLHHPDSVKTATQKKLFTTRFRQWTRATRQNPTGDIQHMADQIAQDFGDQIRLMLYPAVIKNDVVKHLRGVSFVRFHVRSPAGKKIWLTA